MFSFMIESEFMKVISSFNFHSAVKLGLSSAVAW